MQSDYKETIMTEMMLNNNTKTEDNHKEIQTNYIKS